MTALATHTYTHSAHTHTQTRTRSTHRTRAPAFTRVRSCGGHRLLRAPLQGRYGDFSFDALTDSLQEALTRGAAKGFKALKQGGLGVSRPRS